MVIKSAVFFVAFFVACQAVTIDEARQKLAVLDEKSNVAIKHAVSEMENLQHVIRQLSNGVVNVGAQEIHNESVRLIGELENIIELAKKEGVNIDQCVSNERRLLQEISDLSGLEVAACANRFTSQAEQSLNKAMDHVRNIVAEVFEIAEKLEKCKPTDVNCVNTIVAQIEFLDLDIPRRIQEEWDLGQNKAEANRLYLGECGAKATQDLVSHANPVINKVDICLDKIIHPPKPLLSKILLLNL